MTQLHKFVQCVAAAPAGAQAEMFAEAEQFVPFGAAELAPYRFFVRCGGFADAALLLYRSALPEFGFQFGVPPPLEQAEAARPVALSWRRGEARAAPYRAATPALALLYAAASECARRNEARRLAACGRCGGLGSYVTIENRKQICTHAGSERAA